MNISLTPELEQLIQEKISSGQYQSASEVIQEGLRLLETRDRLSKVHVDELQEKMKYAGSWEDMPDDIFTEFTEKIDERRQQSVSGRRQRETSFD